MCLADDFKIQGLTSHSELSGYSFYLPLIQAWALERPTTWNQQQQIKESVSLIKWPERKSPMHIKEGILSPFPHLSQCSPSFHNEVRAWYLWVSIQRLEVTQAQHLPAFYQWKSVVTSSHTLLPAAGRVGLHPVHAPACIITIALEI